MKELVSDKVGRAHSVTVTAAVYTDQATLVPGCGCQFYVWCGNTILWKYLPLSKRLELLMDLKYQCTMRSIKIAMVLCTQPV